MKNLMFIHYQTTATMKKKTTDFAEYVSEYFQKYLLNERNVSKNTIKSYKESLIQFMCFMQEQYRISPNKLQISQITERRVKEFLMWLERTKHISSSTRNTRLCAIHAFVRFVTYSNIECLAELQKILAIKAKKRFTDVVNYISVDGIKAILEQPDKSSYKGYRDFTLLSLLYDTGCRVQELVDLTVGSIVFDKNSYIKVIGKGNKARIVPIVNQQVDILKKYIKIYKLDDPVCLKWPLFFNSNKVKLTRQSVSIILIKYANRARIQHPELIPDMVSPHVFRHSKAMHLLQAGVNIVYIRDILGHVSITTTEIYAKADSKAKREAIENAYKPITDSNEVPIWEKNKSIMDWLKMF